MDMAQGADLEFRLPAHDTAVGPAFSFGDLRLFPGARLLLRGDEPVALGSRAFDLLHVLIAARGVVVTKEDLLARVWPTTCVDECNLRFQVAVLRKALGREGGLVKTIAGRGYLFAEEIADQHRKPPEVPPARAFPAELARLANGDVPAGSDELGRQPSEAAHSLFQLLLRELTRSPAWISDLDEATARPHP
jgi:DNA-binding winged helix-turn-helix (wHTH) protein